MINHYIRFHTLKDRNTALYWLRHAKQPLPPCGYSPDRTNGSYTCTYPTFDAMMATRAHLPKDLGVFISDKDDAGYAEGSTHYRLMLINDAEAIKAQKACSDVNNITAVRTAEHGKCQAPVFRLHFSTIADFNAGISALEACNMAYALDVWDDPSWAPAEDECCCECDGCHDHDPQLIEYLHKYAALLTELINNPNTSDYEVTRYRNERDNVNKLLQ